MKISTTLLLIGLSFVVACGDDAVAPENNTNNTNNTNNKGTCAQNEYDDQGTCRPFTVCAAGERVTVEGGATADRTCSPCDAGSYSDSENADACVDWRLCVAGEFVATAGSATQDRACEACAVGTYTTGDNQSVCVQVGACAPGTVQTVAATPRTDAVCEPCEAGSYCAGGEAAVVPCAVGSTWDDDADPSTVCVDMSVCAPGEFVDQDGDSTADRACVPCGVDAFSDQDNATECTPWSVCLPNEVELVAASATNDRRCVFGPWTVQFGTRGFDDINAMALADNGDIVVAGRTTGAFGLNPSSGGEDAFVARFDASGARLWIRQFGSSENDRGEGVAVDKDGNVYVAGYAFAALPGQTSGGGADAWVRKYDPTGTELWTRQFGNAGQETIQGMSVDDNGNVVVIGNTSGVFAGQTSVGAIDAFVRVYDTDGTELWTRQFGTSGNDYGNAVTFTSSGDIVGAGSTYGEFAGQTQGGSQDAFLRKYDSAGAEVWTKQIASGGNASSKSVVEGPTGDIILAGQIVGALDGQTALGSRDGFVQQFDSMGALTWTQQFGTNQTDLATGVDVFADGSVVVTGRTIGEFSGYTSQGSTDVFVVKFDGTGGTLWVRQMGTASSDAAGAVRFDPDGFVIVAGSITGAWPGLTFTGLSDAYVMRLDP